MIKFGVYISINRFKRIHDSNLNSSFLINLVNLNMKQPFLADAMLAVAMGKVRTYSPLLLCMKL